MHGQGRAEYKARQRDDTISAGLSQKARQWHALTSDLISQRHITEDSESTRSLQDHLRMSEKLLTVNPDPIYLWNCRRETILQMPQSSDGSSTRFIQDERSLTASCLKRNPKAYGAWFHRKWCIRYYVLLETKINVAESEMNETSSKDSSRMDLSQRFLSMLNQELDLCSDFLQHDERNFHCWNYRRFIVSITATILALMSSGMLDFCAKGSTILQHLQENLDGSWWWRSSNIISIPGPQISPNHVEYSKEKNDIVTLNISLQDEMKLIEKEWKFTEEKITKNFSNGSAFHYRSILIQYLHEIQNPINFLPTESTANDKIEQRNFKKLQLIMNELEIVHNAIFTEPDDQTPWWYYRFLMKWATANFRHDSFDRSMVIVVEHLQDILQNEVIVINDLIETENNTCKWGYLTLHFILKILISFEPQNEEKQKEWTTQAQDCLHHLIDIDADRIHRYASLL